MVTIQLTQGQVTFIDALHANLAGLAWYAYRSDKTFYAKRNVQKPDGKWTTEYLHQRIAERMGIIGPPDHIDGNGLNNRKDNLRPANASQQQAHKVRQSNNTSGYKGVYWCKRSLKWRAYIRVNGKRRYLGVFTDPIDAAKAYDRAAVEAFGEFAVLNFPVAQNIAAQPALNHLLAPDLG